MRNLTKACGLAALMLCVVGIASQADAGGRRRSCNYNYGYNYQSNYGSTYYAAPTVAGSTMNNGRVQYQSGYQASAAPAPAYGPAPVYYSNNHLAGPYDSSNYYFHEPRNAFDPNAIRKARDGRMQH